jgi:hypothetical protein
MESETAHSHLSPKGKPGGTFGFSPFKIPVMKPWKREFRQQWSVDFPKSSLLSSRTVRIVPIRMVELVNPSFPRVAEHFSYRHVLCTIAFDSSIAEFVVKCRLQQRIGRISSQDPRSSSRAGPKRKKDES